ncbi:MAG TPA: NUDIX hydrolase [Candidatus Rubrimentiphilum sp.]|nr:NUDIX hydrolase [Candidatus Rubrimentiphilum sp.]
MTRIHLATALVRRGGDVLLVASKYPNHAQPLWNLPGGRQMPGELLTETARRELLEETGLHGTVRELCYVSESYDGETQITTVTFAVDAAGTPAAPTHGDHVVSAEWVAAADLSKRLAIAVVREPLLAYLEKGTRYAGYAEAGVSIVFPD